MSLDWRSESQREQQFTEALDVIFNFFSSSSSEKILIDHINEAIDDGLNYVGLDDVDRGEVFDEAVKLMLEANGWDSRELRRENSYLKDNVADLQRQLREAYKRIAWHKDVYK
tara:strand:+ start:301 stop:639 length:339 start_codon:yes stop_codon:yes gene_type:complete